MPIPQNFSDRSSERPLTLPVCDPEVKSCYWSINYLAEILLLQNPPQNLANLGKQPEGHRFSEYLRNA
jgi:hypothetical protein